MKRNILWIEMLVMVLALSVVFMGCGSSPVPTVSNVSPIPDIDYSRVGPYDSVILAYLDPQLVKTVKPTDPSVASQIMTFEIMVDGNKFSSPSMVNIKYNPPASVGFAQSCQMQIPNGTHIIHVSLGKLGGSHAILPFEVDFGNVAVTYKIRLATDEEKRAGRIGVGNEVYTLEEVAQQKLRDESPEWAPRTPPVSSVPVIIPNSVPDIDYSRIGPNDSVIRAYIDPLLVKTVDHLSYNISDQLSFAIMVDGMSFTSPPITNIIMQGLGTPQSFQMQVPNGAHTIYLNSSRGVGGAQDRLPFEVDFDNVAITYKIRLATDEEKRAGGVGLGNEVYMLEEVARQKLR